MFFMYLIQPSPREGLYTSQSISLMTKIPPVAQQPRINKTASLMIIGKKISAIQLYPNVAYAAQDVDNKPIDASASVEFLSKAVFPVREGILGADWGLHSATKRLPFSPVEREDRQSAMIEKRMSSRYYFYYSPRLTALPVFPFLTQIPLTATTAAQMSYQDTFSTGPVVSTSKAHRRSGAGMYSVSAKMGE